jgi:hypothetical protein
VGTTADHAGCHNEGWPAQRLANPEAVMLVEDWQKDLRKITMRIGYDDPQNAENRLTYERHVFLHRDHGGE